ncbi:MAG: hypothetical protein NTW93_04620 [Phycisphaerae bacterium]|nr:hypothetical protein [Phycisphaerae bacterium]
MKLTKLKIVVIFIAFIAALIVPGVSYIWYLRINDPIYKATGWTKKQFIRWAYKVEPVKEHNRWRTSDSNEELMDPNTPFLVHILNDIKDIAWASTRYKYQWVIHLPDNIPKPVTRVLTGISQQDIGKYIDQIFPDVNDLLSICSYDEKGRIIGSEKVRIKLLALSEDKHTISVETEPFFLSDNPDIHGKCEDVVILLGPMKEGTVNICE